MADPDVFVVPGQKKGTVAPFRSGFADPFTATVKAGGSVTGGRLVDLVSPGDRVIDTSGADSVAVCGVAMWNAAAGEQVTVATDGVWPLIADGAVSAGDKLVASDDGTVKSLGGTAAAADARQIIGEAEADAVDTAVVRGKLTI